MYAEFMLQLSLGTTTTPFKGGGSEDLIHRFLFSFSLAKRRGEGLFGRFEKEPFGESDLGLRMAARALLKGDSFSRGDSGSAAK